ncbi:MAG: GNAT family N-acetyltransferase [Pseudomonadota bacterium]
MVRGWVPGLIGEAVALHGRLYAADWGFDDQFEATVAADMGAFFSRFDATRDVVLSTWHDGRLRGTVTLDLSDPEGAAGQGHLRWFLVDPAAQGHGLGRRLLQGALDAADAAGASVYLITFEGLAPARRLYEATGFVLVSEEETVLWGQRRRFQRFERPALGNP